MKTKQPGSLMFRFLEPKSAKKCAQARLKAGKSPRRVRRHLACWLLQICDHVTTMQQAKALARDIVDSLLGIRLVRDEAFKRDLIIALKRLDAANDIEALLQDPAKTPITPPQTELTEADVTTVVGDALEDFLQAA